MKAFPSNCVWLAAAWIVTHGPPFNHKYFAIGTAAWSGPQTSKLIGAMRSDLRGSFDVSERHDPRLFNPTE